MVNQPGVGQEPAVLFSILFFALFFSLEFGGGIGLSYFQHLYYQNRSPAPRIVSVNCGTGKRRKFRF